MEVRTKEKQTNEKTNETRKGEVMGYRKKMNRGIGKEDLAMDNDYWRWTG